MPDSMHLKRVWQITQSSRHTWREEGWIARKKQPAWPRTPLDTIAAELTVPERVLLFCFASGTDWVKEGVPHSTAHHSSGASCLSAKYAPRAGTGQGQFGAG